MQVFVSQPGRKTITASVRPSDSAGQVKALVERHTGFPVQRQCLYLGGKPLDDEVSLIAQGVAKHAMIELRIRASAAPEEVRDWQRREGRSRLLQQEDQPRQQRTSNDVPSRNGRRGRR